MAKKINLVLYGFAFIANLISFTAGICWAWSSPSIPKLNGSVRPEENPLGAPTTILESSLITSLCNLGAAIGPWLSVAFTDRVGRKKTLLYFAVPVLVANVWLLFASTVTEFCIARFLMGVTCGTAMSLMPIYVSELSEKESRGSVGLFMFLQLTFAQIIVFIMSPFVSIKVISMFALVPIALFLVFTTLLVPESPYYFVLVGKVNEAETCLRTLRRRQDVKKELMEVVECVEDSKKLGKPGLQDLYKSKAALKALAVSLTLMLVQQGTAISPIFMNLQTIFDSTGTAIPGDMTAIVVGAVAFITVLVSASTRIIDKIDRRILLFASELIICFVLVVLGTFFYLKDNNYNVEPLFWLPISCVVLYFTAFNFGIGPVIWQFVGEIFPANIRSLAATICTSFNITLAFMIIFVFPTVSVYLTMAVSLWIFAGITALGAAFVYYVIPETRNKSFLEIQQALGGEKK